ncbi:MAG: YraN family protein [Tepidisphaerales bacterium]
MAWLRDAWRRLRSAVASRPTSDRLPRSRAVGARGERIAEEYLRRHRYRILFRNFRCEAGEIDLIARHSGQLVFVEVKSRSDGAVAPEVQVDRDKQRRVARAARVYLSRYGPAAPPHRFDIVAVVLRADGPPDVRHHVNAFAT